MKGGDVGDVGGRVGGAGMRMRKGKVSYGEKVTQRGGQAYEEERCTEGEGTKRKGVTMRRKCKRGEDTQWGRVQKQGSVPGCA